MSEFTSIRRIFFFYQKSTICTQKLHNGGISENFLIRILILVSFLTGRFIHYGLNIKNHLWTFGKKKLPIRR